LLAAVVNIINYLGDKCYVKHSFTQTLCAQNWCRVQAQVMYSVEAQVTYSASSSHVV